MKNLYWPIALLVLLLSCTDGDNVSIQEELVGEWIEDSQSYGAKIIMFRQGPSIYMKSMYGDRVNSTREMRSVKVDGRQWYIVKGGDSTTYYFINRNSNLEIHNDQGIIATYTKIE